MAIEKLRIGIAGLGRMGAHLHSRWIDLVSYCKQENVMR
jgi:6-phosphogluconate dehydrogenase (decarboxylating)